MIKLGRMALFALYLTGIVAVGGLSCLRGANDPPERTLARLIEEYVVDPERLFEGGPQLAYSLLEPSLLLSGERAAVLVLAPTEQVSYLRVKDDGSGEMRVLEDSTRFPGLESSAIRLSAELEATARERRTGVAKGCRIAVLFVTARMVDLLGVSERVFVSKRSLLSEKQFHERYGEIPRGQYTVDFLSPGEWVIVKEGDASEEVVSDDDVDAYIAANGPPWEYTKLPIPQSQEVAGGPYYVVLEYGIRDEVIAPSVVVTENTEEVVGVFTLPASRRNAYLGKEKAVDLLRVLLPLVPEAVYGKDALPQLLPGDWGNERAR